MTRYQPLWQQSGTYQAVRDRALIDALWPNGGASGSPPVLVNNTMNVSVPAGSCAVPLSDGSAALCVWDAAEVVTLAASPPSGQNRQDFVVCQARDNAIDSGGNNDFIITSVTGTPATPGNVQQPAIPPNSYVLCQVGIVGGSANLNGATIYARRASLTPGASAYYYRTAAFTVAANPGIGGWLDTVEHDDFGGIYGMPSTRNDNLIIIPAAGKYRLEFQATASVAANGWMQTEFYSPKVSGGASWAWANQGLPIASWTGPRCVLQTRFAQGATLEPQMRANVAGTSGIAGRQMTWLLVTYLGP